MDDCHLNWKKVFKEILGEKPASHDEAESEENAIEQKKLTSSKFKSSNENHPSSLKLKNDSSNERCEYKIGNCQSSSQNPSKTFSSMRNDAHFKSYRSIEQNCNLSNDGQSAEVPEWNKVFKNILGGSSSPCDAQEQTSIDLPMKKSIPSRKYYGPPHRRRNFSKRKQSYSASKIEMEAEEKEVLELFARSRLFQYDSSFKSLNDLAGAGVDIFKCEKKFTSTHELKRESKVEAKAIPNSDRSVKPDLPVTGLVANIKPLTSADILDSPKFEITEWWDDDLLF